MAGIYLAQLQEVVLLEHGELSEFDLEKKLHTYFQGECRLLDEGMELLQLP